ncbi:MAG: restriction endonuclease subunit S [Proteobacteria bacterium]|nr:restriction endonuclease subunit S [Pseudomonadota bacterium]MBU1648019.1 restriction endonuclease subunit S [Pseudomonadota bacterium]
MTNIKDYEKLGPLPEKWESLVLKEVVSKLVDGSHNPPSKKESGFPMLSARNIENNQIVFDNFRFISEDDFEKEHARTRIEPGDVLLTIVGTIGRSAVVPTGLKDFALQRSVAVLTPNGVLPKYLMYQLQAPFIQRHFIKNARGTAQKGVYLKTLGQTPIRVAPLEQQKRIVAEIEKQFSRLDEAVANLKRVKANLKRYKAAVLKAAIEGKLTEEWRKQHPDVEPASKLLERILAKRRQKWQEAELAKMKAKGKLPKDDNWKKKYGVVTKISMGEVGQLPDLPSSWVYIRLGELINEPKYGTSKKCDYGTKGVGVLRIPNVVNGFIDSRDLKFAEFDEKECQIYDLAEGDILTIRSNGSVSLVGKCALIKKQDEKYLYAGYLIRLRPIKEVLFSEYLVNCFSSLLLRKQIEFKAKSTSGVNNINSGELQSLIVPVCSKEEQAVILNEVDRRLSVVSVIDGLLDTNLHRAERLRQAILSKAFSGVL